MDQHHDIKEMAREAFAQHVMTREVGKTWKLENPDKRGYWFRVTWTPGAVIVTGDIGDAIYSVWPAMATLWGSVKILNGAEYEYVAGKSNHKTEMDGNATAEALIALAEADLIAGEPGLWTAIVNCYGSIDGRDLHGSIAREVAKEALLTDSDQLTAEQVYTLVGGDPEWLPIRHSYPPVTRWTYEAVQVWARAMVASESSVHRLWRTKFARGLKLAS